MRVFVTGSTGFVGKSVVMELVPAGHSVVGLTRSDEGEAQLKRQGATPLRGTIEDLDLLTRAARDTDGVIRLAFVHDFLNFLASCATDRAAISALAAGLGSDKPLITTSVASLVKPGVVGTEDDYFENDEFLKARGQSELLVKELVRDKGLRGSIVRLPPTTHGDGSGMAFSGLLVSAALSDGQVGYIGDNTWSAGHVDDAAVLYRLALEKGEPGAVYHAVNEEQVPVRKIAEAIWHCLSIPSVSVEEADEYFGWFAFAMLFNNKASSAKTQRDLGWKPTIRSVLDSIPATVEYLKARTA